MLVYEEKDDDIQDELTERLCIIMKTWDVGAILQLDISDWSFEKTNFGTKKAYVVDTKDITNADNPLDLYSFGFAVENEVYVFFYMCPENAEKNHINDYKSIIDSIEIQDIGENWSQEEQWCLEYSIPEKWTKIEQTEDTIIYSGKGVNGGMIILRFEGGEGEAINNEEMLSVNSIMVASQSDQYEKISDGETTLQSDGRKVYRLDYTANQNGKIAYYRQMSFVTTREFYIVLYMDFDGFDTEGMDKFERIMSTMIVNE